MPIINNKPVDVVDVGTGNIANICSAFKKINISYNLCSKVSDFKGGKIILPGVGAFADFMDKLKKRSIDNYIVNKSNENISILGICLGFQVLFSSSTEHKPSKGLNLLKGDFGLIKSDLLIPHVGWNACEIKTKKIDLFNGINNNSDFYFIVSRLYY
jgi:glutamine amidotransferase